MIGINSENGTVMNDFEHVVQSIKDILTTPKGSRVMRRDYGSGLFNLLDKPFSAALILNIYAETAAALKMWEPRFKVKKISHTLSDTGKITLSLSGEYLPNGQIVTLDGVFV
jgi:uncharacterized protein